jgi:membrane-bound serine protease (ClpP class)
MVLFETINIVSVVLFVAGMVLLMIELFVPGFGIFGGLGLVALMLCIVFQAQTFLEGLILFLGVGAILVAISFIAARSMKRGWLYRSSLVLKDTAQKEEGYVSNDDYSSLVGKTGRSLTPLRPAGIAEFDGQKADVVTEGEFIPSHSRVEVTRVIGPRIIVRQLED